MNATGIDSIYKRHAPCMLPPRPWISSPRGCSRLVVEPAQPSSLKLHGDACLLFFVSSPLMVGLRGHFVHRPALVAHDSVAIDFGGIGVMPLGGVEVVIAQLCCISMSRSELGRGE